MPPIAEINLGQFQIQVGATSEEPGVSGIYNPAENKRTGFRDNNAARP